MSDKHLDDIQSVIDFFEKDQAKYIQNVEIVNQNYKKANFQ